MLKTIGQLTIKRDYLQWCFREVGLPVPELDPKKGMTSPSGGSANYWESTAPDCIYKAKEQNEASWLLREEVMAKIDY